MADDKTSAEKPPFYIRHFFLILVILGLLGGFLALTVPSWRSWAEIPCIGFIGSFLQSFIPPSDAEKYPEGKVIADLRLHILYITGGIIAILTLLQTSWKNQVDRRKVEADIQKNEQDAKNEATKREQDAIKSERDHTRQVHAERRSRYTKAVEQLANEKATVRLGGIYTLVGLVDEWLADDALNPEERQKEGQVIINNLCSYIRSPFTLALKAEMFEGGSEPDNYEGDFSKDQAAFHEEQNVRRTVFVEMSKRSSTFTKGLFGQIIDTSLRTWSDFDFDFSRAPIFYPLNAITIEKGKFSGAKFYADANFFDAAFTSNADFSEAEFTQNADFSGAAFAQNANFIWATFTQNADFSRATFTQNADFNEAEFFQNADFNEAGFFQNADFSGAVFSQNVDFIGAAFVENANFSWAKFFQNLDFIGAVFSQNADFSWAKFTQNADFSGAEFTQNADFHWAKFTQNADFSGAEFTQNADFSGATFTQNADFSGATFTQNADFSGATFKGIASFSDSTFEKYSPLFVTTNDELGETYRARFVALPIDQEAHDFTVSEGSFRIPPGEAELRDGVKHHIPVGTILFDPNSWDEEKYRYTYVSEPAKPVENSATEEEKPTE